MKRPTPALRTWPLIGLGSAIVLALTALMWLTGTPNQRPPAPEDFPWHVELVAPDTLRIFGLTLGVSTVADAELRFREAVTPGLFRQQDGTLAAEAYCERVRLAGLQAKVVLGIAASEEDLQAMLARSPGVIPASQGKRVLLTEGDETWLRKQPIVSLTYLPSARPPESTFVQHFGPPATRIEEPMDGGLAIHLLYPRIGLDITLSEGHKPVLQYVRPVDFEKLIRPLQLAEKGNKPR